MQQPSIRDDDMNRKMFSTICNRQETFLLWLFVTFSASLSQAEDSIRQESKTFKMEVFDEVTIRANPTTQIAIHVKQWPRQKFLLWLPEALEPLWRQWDAAIGQQEFVQTARGGLRWTYDRNPQAIVAAELIPREHSLLAEVRVSNRGDQPISHLTAQNCFHLSAAPDFACDDYSRIHIRTAGEWKTLKELHPARNLPMYYREGFLEANRMDVWKGSFRQYNQTQRADHPLIACTSIDGSKTVATVSEDYQCVFHNQGAEYLLCIHSQQAPLEQLLPGEQHIFRQYIYFIDGGLPDAIKACEGDLDAVATD